MNKDYTVNDTTYQDAQEKFYEANVVGNMTFEGDDDNG